MEKKWLLKLSTPILALAIISACGTPNNNNNDNVPQNEENAPENTRAPGTQNPDDNNMRNNEQNAPDNDGYNNPDQGKSNYQNKLDLKNRR